LSAFGLISRQVTVSGVVLAAVHTGERCDGPGMAIAGTRASQRRLTIAAAMRKAATSPAMTVAR
jgi:hypothetical protein